MCVYSLESANILAREFPRVQCPEKRNVWDPVFLLNRVYIDSFPRKELQSYNVFLGMAKLKTDFLRILPSMTLIYSACCVVFFANMCFSFTQPHNIYTYIYIHVYVYIYILSKYHCHCYLYHYYHVHSYHGHCYHAYHYNR